MRIRIYDWAHGRLMGGTGYTHEQEIEGTVEDAGRIAGEIFLKGPNVMIRHVREHNKGTRKNPDMVPAWVSIDVDDQRFQQR